MSLYIVYMTIVLVSSLTLTLNWITTHLKLSISDHLFLSETLNQLDRLWSKIFYTDVQGNVINFKMPFHLITKDCLTNCFLLLLVMNFSFVIRNELTKKNMTNFTCCFYNCYKYIYYPFKMYLFKLIVLKYNDTLLIIDCAAPLLEIALN